MTRVQIGRPYRDGRRDVLVDGTAVGLIAPAYPPGRRLRSWVVSMVEQPAYRWLFQSARLADAINWVQSYQRWPVHYWVAVWGSYGCLPDTRECCSSRAIALGYVVDGLELGDGRRGRELRRQGYVDLGPKYGAQYAEIVACPCEICRGRTIADSEAGECERCAD